MTMDLPSYKTGRWVGEIIGSVRAGCTEMTGTWPKDALPEDKDALIQWAKIMQLHISFQNGDFTISEKKPTNLKVIK